SADSREELSARLSEAGQIFRQPFQLYAEGRIQTIAGTNFTFGIGTTPGAKFEEQRAALREAMKANARNEAPEWLRKTVATAAHGEAWLRRAWS
ncbi:MAG TPA: hypothetical protein VJK27_09185, partial [Terriglobales bacterium]|nr:hypothetical protein [Terriglobales bacterium]